MLTQAQRTTLRAHVLANTTPVDIDGETFTLAQVLAPPDGGNRASGAFSRLADHYNALATPAFFVWRRDVPVEDIFERIVWANLTPALPAEANQDLDALFRSNVCISMQMSLQILLMGRQTLDATRANLRDGLRDALQAVPSNANGTTRPAGWTQVQAIIARPATRGEAVFANTSGGQTGAIEILAATARVEGAIPIDDFIALRDL